MKLLLIAGLTLSLSAYAQMNNGPVVEGYAPNDGSARPGNPGTGLEETSRSNTTVTPVPEDTDDLTLQGKTQTGPYRTNSTKQSQEDEKEEELDYRAIPKVDHSDEDATENP